MTGSRRLGRLLVFSLATDADDPILGFTSEWLAALARRVEHLDVVTMRAGRVELPANVRVFSVGKERGFSEPERAVEFYRILGGLLRRHRYDACFAHMMPLFTVMGWPLLRPRQVPIVLWYAHGATPPVLRLAARLADRVVTSDSEAFRLPRPEPVVIGQGVDTAAFRPVVAAHDAGPLTLVAVGRVSPVKRVERMVEALAALGGVVSDARPVLHLVGPVLEGDGGYADSIRALAGRLGVADAVVFAGPVARKKLPQVLGRADVALNLTPGGSFDKAALEAMACGVPLVTTNPSLAGIVRCVCPELVPVSDAPEDVARACLVAWELGAEGRAEVGVRLREIVVAEHSLERLADRLVEILGEEASKAALASRVPGRTTVWRELWRGKSVLRALANAAMAERVGRLQGLVVDVGSGAGASYRRLAAPSLRWIGLDADPAAHPDIVADATRPWPLRPGCADAVVCSWFLYIPPDPEVVLAEGAKVLRSGGTAIVTTPLVYPPNPEPSDHWRFTDEGLCRLLRRAGLTPVEVVPLGDRFAAAVYCLAPYLRPRQLAAVVNGIAVVAVRLAARLARGAPRFPVGYLAVARADPAALGGDRA